MTQFNRTWEKVLAWIANVLLIIVTAIISYTAFSNVLSTVMNNSEFKTAFEQTIKGNAELATATINTDDVLALAQLAVKVEAIIFIVALVLALIATFIMKSRIISGIMFLLSAIMVGIATIGYFIPIYGLYFVVSILLFVRKEPVTDNYNEPQVEKVEYL